MISLYIGYIWYLSSAFPSFYIWEGGDVYDKKRTFSIYHNITTICSCNYFTSEIAKTLDSHYCDCQVPIQNRNCI